MKTLKILLLTEEDLCPESIRDSFRFKSSVVKELYKHDYAILKENNIITIVKDRFNNLKAEKINLSISFNEE